MNVEVKEAWITALESGEYKQTKGALTRVDYAGNESHCCLGVLCELAVKAGVIERFETSEGKVGYDRSIGFMGTQLPPSVVIDWAGLFSDNPWVDYDEGYHSLVELNDEVGLTFPQIAVIIREQL